MSDSEKSQKTELEEMCDVSKMMEELMSFDSIDFEEISEFMKIIAYKGFDPAELVDKMRLLQPDADALAKDLSFLIVQFLKIGKQSKKKKSEISELKRLTKLYQITKDSSDREATTLRRIAIAFAPMTVRILMKNKIDRPVTDIELSAIAGESLPWCIRTQIYLCTLPACDSPAVVSQKAIFKTAIQATVCYSYLESKVICKEGRENKWTETDHMANVMKYAVISLKSEHLSEKDRLDVWTETMPFLSSGMDSMQKLILKVESEVPEFASMFESSFGASISSSYLSRLRHHRSGMSHLSHST